MFARLGRFVYRFRYAVIVAMVAALAGLGVYGIDIAHGKHLSQGGYFDEGSQSSKAAVLLDKTYGRDHNSDVLVLYTAPSGETINTPSFYRPIVANLNNVVAAHPDAIGKVNGAYWQTASGTRSPQFGDKSHTHAFASVAIRGDDDTTVLDNYNKVKNDFYIPGVNVQVAGAQPVAGTINTTMNEDVHRMELLAVPVVAILLFFVFGGLIAAVLPLIVGGLTIVGGWGVIRILTNFTDVNSFVGPVVSMVGLGLAIDYGLFIVSRFREEIAEGYDTGAAVRRSVMTAGRTVVMSATIIVASCAGLLIFPQGFLKSLAYGAMASVGLAAITAITVLAAILGVLGRRVDALGLKWMRKTKTADEIESSVWGRLTRSVMRNPLKYAIPIVVCLALLIIPVKSLAFGGLSEKLLPPNDTTRVAQEHFDQVFPQFRTNTVDLVIQTQDATQIDGILNAADKAPGLSGIFEQTNATRNDVYKYETRLAGSDPKPTMRYLRSIAGSDGTNIMVTGNAILQQDSLDTLIDRLPIMIAVGVLVTAVLMFLTFGSVVLPVKAALMSALGLGTTLGILTWVFIDGHGARLLNFTPGPIMAPVLVLIIALIFGLSTDYEVFLLSRMVEARATGASTTEAIRVGMSHTSRIITAAALILIVVTGAFGLSHLVMMQYIAYGMISALVIDATVLRMFLVPATMKLLGDDCWWAPAWMKRLQERIGLAEPVLVDERLPTEMPVIASAEPRSDRPEDARTVVLPSLATGTMAQIPQVHLRDSRPSTPSMPGPRPVPEPSRLEEPDRPVTPPPSRRPILRPSSPGPRPEDKEPSARTAQTSPAVDRSSIEEWLAALRAAERRNE